MLDWTTSAARLFVLCAIALVALAVPRTASACDKDTDCKGDRVCEGGKCVSGATPGACEKDVDCPGAEVCEQNRCEPPKTDDATHALVGTWQNKQKPDQNPWVISFSGGRLSLFWGEDVTAEVHSWDGRLLSFSHRHTNGYEAKHIYELISPTELRWVESQAPFGNLKPADGDDTIMTKR